MSTTEKKRATDLSTDPEFVKGLKHFLRLAMSLDTKCAPALPVADPDDAVFGIFEAWQ